MSAVTLENIEIAVEYIRWCRMRGDSYRDILLSVQPHLEGFLTKRCDVSYCRVLQACAQANATDRAQLSARNIEDHREAA